MNISDILKKLAIALDNQTAQQAATDVGPQDEPAAPEGDEASWMPPQTQELELLKKAAGIPSEYDGEQPTDDAPVVVATTPEEPSCGCGGAPEEEPLMSSDQEKVGEAGIKRGVGGDTLLKSIHDDDREAADRMEKDPRYQQTLADRDKKYTKDEAEAKIGGPVELVDDDTMWMNVNSGEVLPAELTDPFAEEVEEEIHEEELTVDRLRKLSGL